MNVDILSLFPEFFRSPQEQSILKRAIEKEILKISHRDIRDFTLDKHRRVDDRPFGGGPGMLLKPEPVSRALESVKKEHSHVVFVSPHGKVLDQSKCRELATKQHIIFLCGHYEGIDERGLDLVDERISIGNYILTHGGYAVLVILDAVVRLLPGVLGNAESAQQESFEDGCLEEPQYTRPREFEGKRVPEVLLNGDHKKIEAYRKEQRRLQTLRKSE